MIRNRLAKSIALTAVLFAAGAFAASFAEDSEQLLTVDHYVRVKSTVPAIAGQTAQIYVRERAMAGTVLRSSNLAARVVLFIHGRGTPAEVAFDVPHEDYSWMAYLARAGFDVFSMDVTGYGRSTRPAPMDDPCNLSQEQQKNFVPSLLSEPCVPGYAQQLGTIASDWNDIGAVVDYIRARRRVDRVSLVAWSLGGPRAGGYAARNPAKVDKLVILAPAYNRTSSAEPPAALPAAGAAFDTQSRDEFMANWERQVGCPAQYDAATSDTVWTKMVESDSVGATWGTGVRRAPQTTTWGWNAAVVGKMQTPMLMIAGVHDKQVPPDRVRELYSDLGARQKVFIDLACSSHNAMWESNHLLLFRASLEWLTKGSVNGTQEGMLRLGY
jgi:pimeloyl-ACP methyl ester carboxylesterase